MIHESPSLIVVGGGGGTKFTRKFGAGYEISLGAGGRGGGAYLVPMLNIP